MHYKVFVVVIGCAWLFEATLAGKYAENFSQAPWLEFPGGRFKASTSKTLTASTIAGALFQLNPGGLRELHWHDAAEWAIVLEGSCTATAVDQGKTHPADTWTFSVGDLWYFPANVPHSILGLAPRGCTFLTGYNSADLNELDSFSASSWLPTVPVDTAAQALGISVSAAQRILEANKSKKPTFIPQGNEAELATDQPSLPRQFPPQIHRFPLLQNIPEVTNPDGSTVNLADVTRFPISTELSGALVTVAAGSMRQLHWHLAADEWQFVINGTFEAQVFLKPGEYYTSVLKTGDLGFAPHGSAHYFKNVGKETGVVVLIFNKGSFTNIDVSNFLGGFPPSWVASSLNIPTAAAEQFDYYIDGFAPGQTRPESAITTAMLGTAGTEATTEQDLTI